MTELLDPDVVEVAIGGRPFRLTTTGVGDSSYIALKGEIGNLYTLTVEGNAPLEAIAAHIERIDFYRLEAEGADAGDPLDVLGPIGKAVLSANGIDHLPQ